LRGIFLNKQIFYTTFFILTFNQFLFSQTDSVESRSFEFNFKLGLNSNFIIDNSDFQSGFSGIGIFFEPFITDNFSLVLSYNSFTIKTNKSGFIKTGKGKISTKDLFFLMRYRFTKNNFIFYPEIGFGDWMTIAGYLTIGAGIDIFIKKDLFFSTSIDYLVAGQDYFNDRGSDVWTSSLLKININLCYLFSL